MFTTHIPVYPIYTLLMAEPNARAQLQRMETMTKAIIRKTMTSRARWDEYIPLWQVIKLQARYNSPLFASHGIGHSIRTAYYMWKLWPAITPVLLWAALLHDVGYSEYDICSQCQDRIDRIRPYVSSNAEPTGIYPEFYRANKFLHAQLGANMVSSILNQYPRLFSKGETATIVNAIRYHNSDSHSKQLYQPKIHGTLLTVGQHDIHRHYVPVHFFQDKCLALLRIADNLDITRARLTLEKKSIAVVLYQRKIAHDDNVNRLALWGQYTLQYPPQGRSEILTTIATKTTAQEFKFTYSLWIIKHLHFVQINWSNYVFDLAVTLYTTPIEALTFQNNLTAALYQFKRMYDAFKSIWIHRKRLSDIVRVNIQGQWHTLKELAI